MRENVEDAERNSEPPERERPEANGSDAAPPEANGSSGPLERDLAGCPPQAPEEVSVEEIPPGVELEDLPPFIEQKLSDSQKERLKERNEEIEQDIPAPVRERQRRGIDGDRDVGPRPDGAEDGAFGPPPGFDEDGATDFDGDGKFNSDPGFDNDDDFEPPAGEEPRRNFSDRPDDFEPPEDDTVSEPPEDFEG